MMSMENKSALEIGLSMISFRYKNGMGGDVDTKLIKRHVKKIMDIEDARIKKEEQLCQKH